MDGADADSAGAERARIMEWLRIERLPPEFDVDAHPRDEMLRFLAAAPAVRRGAARLAWLRSGQEAALALDHALRCAGRTFAAPARVLEFASGFGRVTRHLLRWIEPARLTACEIVPEAVEHVARSFGIESLRSCADPASQRWPRRFDVILVASLFSHLPRPRFAGWLSCLRAALADDGVLIFSTHGRSLPIAPPPDDGDFAFVPQSESTTLAPAEYGTSFVEPGSAAAMARAAGFVDLRWRERELWMLQDLFVAGAAPLAGAGRWDPAPILDGAIDGIERGAGGEVWLHGWVASRDPGLPVAQATLHLGRRLAVPATLHPPRREGEALSQPIERVKSEWHVHAKIPRGWSGSVPLALEAGRGDERRAVDVRTIDLATRCFVDA